MRKPNIRLKLKSYFLLAAVSFLFATQSMVAQPDGAKLFKANCAACHKPDKDLVGPALQGTTTRWEGNEEMLYKWIKDPQKALATGDPYVKKLWDTWFPKAGPMTPQALNDEEIAAVLVYIENYTPPAPKAAAGGSKIIYKHQKDSWIWLFSLGVVLLLAVMVLRKTIHTLQNANRIQKGEDEEALEPVGDSVNHWIAKNRVVVFVMVLLVSVFLLISAWDWAFDIGVYTGYQPKQPIDYSHKVHAGDMEMECVYCHTGALKSRTAMIPSANVCMNCHKAISTGTNTGTVEIQKIYDAIGWNGSEYTGESHPIEWVKVHNLPDHVYFSHQQHYVVGNIDCIECHDDMTKLGVARQNKPLTMVWCLDCHNKQQIDMNNNGYYEEMHKRLVDNGAQELKKYLEDDKITVREMGGFECAKCHY